MNDIYKGLEAVDGEFFNVTKADDQKRRPFKAFLDVGLVRTTTGNRVFGALKGAADGGLYVPHNTKRFPGYHLEKKEVTAGKGRKAAVVEKGKSSGAYDAKEHRDHIFGAHIQTYMDILKKENKDRFKKQFNRWEAALTKAKVATLEALYKKAHAEIRKNPKHAKTARKQPAVRKQITKAKGVLVQSNFKGAKWLRQYKLTNLERKARVAAKIQKAMLKK
jgi:large subunit ribosomal protein L5e